MMAGGFNLPACSPMKSLPRSLPAFACALLSMVPALTRAGDPPELADAVRFAKLIRQDWKPAFEDPCTGDWKQKWTLDGEIATVTNTKSGMELKAGPEARNDAHHAVLWTKDSFKGDVKIEYTYTPTDEHFQFVTILYIQATGSGKEGFDADISKWADFRKAPSMRSYYNNMNLYHISYNAYGAEKAAGKDYIRGRRYMGTKKLKGTELDNEYHETGFFKPGVPHQITVIKRDKEVFMHIQADGKEKLCHFVNSKFPAVTEGRIGLRHMFTRSARYKDFKVSTLR